MLSNEGPHALGILGFCCLPPPHTLELLASGRRGRRCLSHPLTVAALLEVLPNAPPTLAGFALRLRRPRLAFATGTLGIWLLPPPAPRPLGQSCAVFAAASSRASRQGLLRGFLVGSMPTRHFGWRWCSACRCPHLGLRLSSAGAFRTLRRRRVFW